ncbi:MAG: GatB/YqeY domain-containing protein [Candidatus Saccharibacteria bacterium]|nr:GatB/YqeY domain-containing protein [Candidatus Saccharibacteria bacterium]
MSLKNQIDADIKVAMLAGEKTLVTTLRGLKSAILNVEVAKGLRETGLPDSEITDILAKEAKKRQESADMYIQGNSKERADAELQEKAIIERYLPKQLSEQEIQQIINEVTAELGTSVQQMGQIIGAVKAKTSGSADGAIIAKLVKEKLQ